MDGWLLWLIAAAILAFGEIHTQGFFLLPFAAGAVGAALVSGIGGGAVGEWAAFLGLSLVLLAVMRPLARSHRRMPPHIRTGSAALVGQSAMVVERIANREAAGCVRIGGEMWTARALEEDGVIEVGRRVQVIEIRGATALVSE